MQLDEPVRASPRSEPNPDELSAGQIIIVIARWLLIATGLAIILWSPLQQDLGRIKVSLLSCWRSPSATSTYTPSS